MKITKQHLQQIIKEEILKQSLIDKIKNLFKRKYSNYLEKYYDAVKAGVSKDQAAEQFIDPVVDIIAQEIQNNTLGRSIGWREEDLAATGGREVLKPGGFGGAEISESE